METQITLQALVQACAIIVGLWGFIKIIMEIIKAVNDRHDKEKKWDEYEVNLQRERDQIYKKYDAELETIKAQINENHADTEAKIQELKADVLMLTRCMSAVLDGLKQLNCNGVVSESKKALDEFLMGKAYDL